MVDSGIVEQSKQKYLRIDCCVPLPAIDSLRNITILSTLSRRVGSIRRATPKASSWKYVCVKVKGTLVSMNVQLSATYARIYGREAPDFFLSLGGKPK